MSVLIKGMKMPTNCDECYIREKDTCPLTRTNVTGWGRPLNCPLVPVPPHGRLIDADALMKKLNNCMFPSDMVTTRAVSMAVNWLKESPTILEAEVGE